MALFDQPAGSKTPRKNVGNDEAGAAAWGGVAPRDELPIEKIASLAHSLFADGIRNRVFMPAWLAQSLITQGVAPPPTPTPPNHSISGSLHDAAGGWGGSAPLSTWAEDERKRQRDRMARRKHAIAKRGGGNIKDALKRQDERMLRALTPAATAAAGRRLPRATTQLISTISAMKRSASAGDMARSTASGRGGAPQTAADNSPVASLQSVFRMMLLHPIHFTIVAGGKDDTSLRLFPFGSARSHSQFSVPGSLLNATEVLTVQYLAITPGSWADVERYVLSGGGTNGHGEVLVAAAEANDAFELAFDRVALVHALCDVILYGAGPHVRCRHVLEAAIVSIASEAAVVDAGYHDTLIRLAHSVRLAPLPPLPIDDMARVRAAEYVARYRVRSVPGTHYFQLIRSQAHRGAEPPPTPRCSAPPTPFDVSRDVVGGVWGAEPPIISTI